ncbi:RNA polymerase sigma factor [Chitinophaga niabensis]|uniref:RNA polymerase sigma-70 factor, ECF subfamily n=1 Tax=Chitinophaga niabensis TaxID=536979 RepID=A0A1N6GIP2_9BACT|nr:RNA polymerase sigma-70 factor [Chitinophaga niabensis]SIO07262.1 RNA polymerase sigma-70 factor, ECF subfamily [Chitinophaga niabensis]
MYNSYSDEQLLSLLKDGDIGAFNMIYDRYSRPLYLYILSKTDRGETSKDVLQDLFATLWEKRFTLDIHLSLRSYLYQSVRHKIIDLYRKDSTYRKYLQQLIEHFDAQPHNISETYDYKAKASEVFEAINRLPARMKEIFMLSRFENLSIEQIASRLDLSQQTVKNQITKALKILRTHYTQTDLLMVAVILSIL